MQKPSSRNRESECESLLIVAIVEIGVSSCDPTIGLDLPSVVVSESFLLQDFLALRTMACDAMLDKLRGLPVDVFYDLVQEIEWREDVCSQPVPVDGHGVYRQGLRIW